MGMWMVMNIFNLTKLEFSIFRLCLSRIYVHNALNSEFNSIIRVCNETARTLIKTFFSFYFFADVDKNHKSLDCDFIPTFA